MRMKSATNLSLRRDLVRRAKKLDLNLSEVVEAALEEKIAEVERERWLAENRDAILARAASPNLRARAGSSRPKPAST